MNHTVALSALLFSGVFLLGVGCAGPPEDSPPAEEDGQPRRKASSHTTCGSKTANDSRASVGFIGRS